MPDEPPTQLGGVSLYHKHLINYLKNKDIKITWAYFGDEDKTYSKKGINYIEIKKSKFQIKGLENNFKVKRFLKRNHFNIVFTTGGPWTYFYSKPKDQKLIQIFHGTVYYFYESSLKRFSILSRIALYPFLNISKLTEKPHKNVDKIICVSNKVKKQVKDLYGKHNIKVIQTGVDLNEFKPGVIPKINENKLYGLYVGGGGYWTKGLDRAINLSREIYKLNPNYKLIIIGPDQTKTEDLLYEDFIEFREDVPREDMKYYYQIADIFLCMSRYEGGAPTLVVSEAMASGCLVICAKSAEQEIIKNGKNGLIINEFREKDAKRILNTIKDKKKKERIIENSVNTIQSLSLEKWGKKFLKLLNL